MRDVMIKIRATADEKKRFHDLAVASGYDNLAGWFRFIGSSYDVRTKEKTDSLEAELRATRRELQAIGNNLNQVAHHLNSGHSVDVGQTIQDVEHAILSVESVLHTLTPSSYIKRRRGGK